VWGRLLDFGQPMSSLGPYVLYALDGALSLPVASLFGESY